MRTKVLPNVLIGIETEKFAHNFHGQDLTVGELGWKASLTEARGSRALVPHFLTTAQHSNDKVFKGHDSLLI
jgi:hypothetical protein